MELLCFPPNRLIQLDREPNPELTGVPPDTPPERDLFLRALFVMNRTEGELALDRLSFTPEVRGTPVLTRSYQGDALRVRIAQSTLQRASLLPPLVPFAFGGHEPPADEQLTDELTLPPGRGVCLLYEHFRVSSADPLDRLVVSVDCRGSAGPTRACAELPVESYAPTSPLRFPLDCPTHVFTSYDSLYVLSHRRLQSQEYAFDFVGADPGGRIPPKGSANRGCFGYGEPIRAVADGTVVACVDGYPENPCRGELLPPDELARLGGEYGVFPTLVGNHVVIAHPGGEHSLYVHLIPGSLTALPGDMVSAGQAIGRLGNSGMSGGPHLHFALMDGPDVVRAQGLPCRFTGLRQLLWDQPATWVPESSWLVGQG
ncbi:MAG: M23 family metallopeptidase [bacterium]